MKAKIIFFLILAATTRAAAYFEDLGAGARAPGMGNAFVAVADDLTSIYYNPAGLSEIQRVKVMASHSILYSGLSDGSSLGLTNMGFTLPIQGGEWGTAGLLWNQFSLSSLYSEKTIHLAYGLDFRKREDFLKKFSAGLSVKYLSHSFSPGEEAYNAYDGLNATGDVDPVLTGGNTSSAFDLDIGAIYRLNKTYTFGLAVKNLLRSNVAFSSTDEDKLPIRIRAGVSYKSLWMVLSGEAQMEKSPVGSMDKTLIVAAERVFPSLDKGDLSIRGALSAGDRDLRQASLGLSYRINKISFDYGFSIPFGTIKDTAGNHKMAINYHFGGPTVQEQYAMDVLEQYKKLLEQQDYESSKNIANINDPRLKEVKKQVDGENYYEANKLMLEKAREMMPDKGALNLSKRISLVANFFPAMPGNDRKEKWEIMVSSAVKNLLRGYDNMAIKQLTYAQSINQQDTNLSAFLEKAEEATHIKAARVPQDFTKGYSEYKIYESDILYNQKKYEDTIIKLNEALIFEPENTGAMKKMGSCYYLMGDYNNAVKYWEKALRIERDFDEKKKLTDVITQAKKKQTSSWQLPADALETAAPEDKKTRDAREIEKMYQGGVEYYTKGEYGKAADLFRKILNMDPQNSQAKKALERIIRLAR